MTTSNISHALPNAFLRGQEEMLQMLSEIDYPSVPPQDVVNFLASHADDKKNAIGIMNIVDGAVADWRRQEPEHDWDDVLKGSSVLPEIVAALTPDQAVSLHGLYLIARSQ